MTQKINQNQILRLWLNILVVINIVYPILLWGTYFLSVQDYGNQIVETSLFTILCIANIVSLVYVSRNLRFGIYLSGTALIIILCISLFISGIDIIPVCISMILMLITFVLLFLQSDGKSIWSQMDNGIDIAHFRHIYQLSIFIIMIVSCFWVYKYSTCEVHLLDNETYTAKSDEVLDDIDKEMLLENLNKTTITLGQISKIEKSITNIPPEYESRIMALRHILVGHIVPDTHDFELFKMTYFLRKDALSEEQQEVLDWFFRQHNEVKDIWQTSGGVSNIATLQKNLKDAMKKRNITEF